MGRGARGAAPQTVGIRTVNQQISRCGPLKRLNSDELAVLEAELTRLGRADLTTDGFTPLHHDANLDWLAAQIQKTRKSDGRQVLTEALDEALQNRLSDINPEPDDQWHLVEKRRGGFRYRAELVTAFSEDKDIPFFPQELLGQMLAGSETPDQRTLSQLEAHRYHSDITVGAETPSEMLRKANAAYGRLRVLQTDYSQRLAGVRVAADPEERTEAFKTSDWKGLISYPGDSRDTSEERLSEHIAQISDICDIEVWTETLPGDFPGEVRMIGPGQNLALIREVLAIQQREAEQMISKPLNLD